MAELKPCKCGNHVEVKYIAGLDISLRKLSNNPFAGPTPTYYIYCNKCGENAFVRLRMSTVTHRDQCKRDLIKGWNNRRANDG